MFLFWGPDLIQLYNDAYLPSFGVGKHPAAMGQRGEDCWGEIWPIIWPQIDDVLTRGKASWNEDALVPIFRNGRIEEVYWTYGYSPACDDSGHTAGVLVVCTETTARVLGTRRLDFMRRLSDATSVCSATEAIPEEALKVAQTASHDIAFGMHYRSDPESGDPRLRASTGIDDAAVAVVDAAVRRFFRDESYDTATRIRTLTLSDSDEVKGGAWPESCKQAVVMRPRARGLGWFVFGLSPRLPFDSSYEHFFVDLLDQIEVSASRVEASRAKDEFLATVSHELRTPLTAMLGWARILTEGESSPERIQKGLTIIERNARAQAQLIDDILDVSRIVAGKVRLSMRRVDTSAVIKAAIETIRPTVTAKGVQLRMAISPDLGDIVADEYRLQQVVWNLLSNAVKFTPKGGEVTVGADRGPSAVVIRVSDTGKGISAAFLPHVFDRFRQDDASTTKQQAGLGLGLSIVRQLVHLHGGKVVAKSDGEKKGATFEVTLPIRAVEPQERMLVSDRDLTTKASDVRCPLSGVDVLVVEDQDDARGLIATVLEDAGANVRQASSVAAAFQILSTADVHAIVSDVAMPNEDGYSLLKRVRADRSLRHVAVPALALTAYARAEDRENALAAGFQEHSSKPIDPARLVRLVLGLVRAARQP